MCAGSDASGRDSATAATHLVSHPHEILLSKARKAIWFASGSAAKKASRGERVPCTCRPIVREVVLSKDRGFTNNMAPPDMAQWVTPELPAEIRNCGDDLEMRPLRSSDWEKGYIQLLAQLTTAPLMPRAEFDAILRRMRDRLQPMPAASSTLPALDLPFCTRSCGL